MFPEWRYCDQLCSGVYLGIELAVWTAVVLLVVLGVMGLVLLRRHGRVRCPRCGGYLYSPGPHSCRKSRTPRDPP